jgi:WD40 repeat protein/tRNA A-37 threonylcarbamoyl transferase component Bud32
MAVNQVPGYEILDKLGEGGMGVVYKARHLKLGRIIALKMILSGGHARSEDLARFQTEAEAIARLQHANIVQVYEVGEHEGRPFFSLEFCPGGSLDRKLNGTPLPALEAARLVQTLAVAMQAAHSKNVIHRDLKPANVLLSEDGTPKITDFGLARKLDDAGQTQSGAIMGTPSYMAPEQAGGKSKELGPACDVYALGAILYELLTGRPPFKAATALDTLMQVVADEPVPPSQLQSKTPKDLETICLKCLAKEPGRRYPSAQALAEDLGRFQAGMPVLARPVGQIERCLRWYCRNRTVASLLVLLAGALLLGTSLIVAFAVQAKLNEAKAVSEAARATAEALKRGEEATRADLEAEAARRAGKQAEKAAEQARQERNLAQFQALRAGNAIHAIQLDQALRAWKQGDLRATEDLLDRVEEPFRQTWEQRHLRDLCLRTCFRLSIGTIDHVAMSEAGDRVLIGCREGQVHWYDVTRGKLTLLAKEPNNILGVALSGDGKRGVSVNYVTGVKVWDIDAGKVLHTLKTAEGETGCVAITPDGTRIVTGGDRAHKTVKVWDAQTGELKRTLMGHTVTRFVGSVAISRDGKRVVSEAGSHGSYAEIKSWDADTGQPALAVKTPPIWNSSVCISPDGKSFVSGGCGVVFDAEAGKEKFRLRGHKDVVNGAAYSADGKFIVTGSGDGTAKLWNAATGEEMLSFKAGFFSVQTIAVSNDGSRVVLGGTGSHFWNTRTAQTKPMLEDAAGEWFAVAMSADGKSVVAPGFGHVLCLWSFPTGKVKHTLPGHSKMIRGVAISADGSRIVSGSDDQTAKVWDGTTGKELFALGKHKSQVNAVAISADGTRVITSCLDGTVKAWDATTGKEIRTFEKEANKQVGSMWGVAIRPDGKCVVSGQSTRIRMWDVETGQETVVPRELVGPAVAFSPDGKRIIANGQNGGLAIWEALGSKEVVVLPGFGGGGFGQAPWPVMALSPDGERVVAGRGQWRTPGTVEVWDLKTAQLKLRLEGHTGSITGLAFSPDGSWIVSAGTDSVRTWHAPGQDARPKGQPAPR